jgi:hypothetical protein
MSATQQTLRLAGPKTRIAPVVGGGILAAVLVIGALAVTRQAPGQQNALPAVAAPTFDAVKFRAEEHAAFAPQVPFDWVRFRAEERAAMYQLAPYGDTLYRAQQLAAPQIPFDAVQFRAEEHTAMNPLAPYADTLYRAQQRAATSKAPSTAGGGASIHAK